MGQLERYGLYVLVLVIFLILGVAIWGGDPAAGQTGMVADGSQVSVPARTMDAAANLSPSERHRSRFIAPGDEFEDLPIAGSGSEGSGSEETPATKPPVQGEAAQPPSAASSAPRTHEIKKGETLEAIAKRVYGDGEAWRRIAAANPGLDPRKLQPGKEIVLPRDPATKTAPATAGGSASTVRKHTVIAGDSPASIAKLYYGAEKHAQSIMKANGITDPKRLRLGAILTIPVLDDM